MNEGEIKVAEKTQFNGNLALLRVCAIIFIISLLKIIASVLFMGNGGVLVLLWSTLTTSSFEDILAMVGLLIASAVVGPLALATFVILVSLGLGIFALVKKNVTALKILAVIMIAWQVLLPFYFGAPGTVVTGLIFNVNLVAAVAVFFIVPKKRVEENNDVVTYEGFNLGLYRFCAIYFLVAGLSGVAGSIYVFILSQVLLGIVSVLAGIWALVKKKTEILMVCSLAIFVQVFWNMLQTIGRKGFEFFMVPDLLIHSLLHTTTVICVAVFFIEPERTRFYLQKIKRLFLPKTKKT
jgi:hypothetical protein